MRIDALECDVVSEIDCRFVSLQKANSTNASQKIIFEDETRFLISEIKNATREKAMGLQISHLGGYQAKTK